MMSATGIVIVLLCFWVLLFIAISDFTTRGIRWMRRNRPPMCQCGHDMSWHSQEDGDWQCYASVDINPVSYLSAFSIPVFDKARCHCKLRVEVMN